MPTPIADQWLSKADKKKKADETAYLSRTPLADQWLQRVNRTQEPDEEEEEKDSLIGRIIKQSFAETTPGLALRAAGKIGESEDLGTVGNIAAGVGSFVLDPVTYVTGGLGGIIGKSAAKKLAAYAVKKGIIGTAARAAPPAISAGVQLGGLEAARDAVQGEFDPTGIAKATIAGAALGPAAAVRNPVLRAGAEVGAMAAVPAAMEARLPNSDDWINAAGTVGGFKLVGAITRAIKRVRAGEDPKPEIEKEIGPELAAKVFSEAERRAEIINAGTPRSDVERALIEAGTPKEAAGEARPFVSATGPSPLDVTPATRKLAALADQPTVSRTQYMEATGAGPRDVPLAAERKAQAVAAAEAIRSRPDQVAEIPARPIIPEGEVPPTAPTDVPGQTTFPAAEPPRETRLSAKAKEARAEADALWAKAEAHKKKNPTLFSTGADPESLKLLIRAFKSEIKADVYSFADYVANIVARIGKEAAVAYRSLIRQVWDDRRTADPRLGESSDVGEIVNKLDAPARPTEIARPDLGVPVQGETAQNALNVARTARRTMAGEPEPTSHTEQRAIAQERLAAQRPELTEKLLRGGWVPTEPGDAKIQIDILNAIARETSAAGAEADYRRMVQANLNYDWGGTQQGVQLAMRGLGDLALPEQRAFQAAREFAKAPAKLDRQIKAAAEKVRRIEGEAPKPAVRPLTAEEIGTLEGKMAAPFGFKPEPKDKLQGPETQKSYEQRLAKARKKADELADAWAVELKKLRAELSARGQNVEAALRGELDPVAHEQFVNVVNAMKSTAPDKLYEIWKMGILSGPATQVVNMAGNAFNTGWYFTAERITDAFLSSAARAMGLKSDGAYFGELKYAARSLVPSLSKAWANAIATWRTEVPQFYKERGLPAQTPFEFRLPSIAGRKSKLLPKWFAADTGQAVRWPGRLLSAADDAMKTISATMESWALAYRQARNEGIDPRSEALTRRMNELMNDPQSEINVRATDTAIRLALQERSDVLDGVSKLTSKEFVRWVIPFTTSPFNIFRTGVRRSPFGSAALAKKIWDAHKSGDWSGVSQRAAEQVLAWGATMALFYMNDPADPWITGGSHPNRKYAVRIPFTGTWFSYGRIEPFATTLGLLVDGINKIHQGADAFEALKAPFDALADRIDNQTFMMGLSDFLRAAQTGDVNHVLNWASKFPASWVPNLVRAPLRNLEGDKPERRVWGKGTDRAERMLRRGLAAFEVMPEYPKYDLWGRPVPKDGSPIPHTDFIWRTLAPAGEAKYVETIGDRMLTRWNADHPDDPVEFKPPNPYYSEQGKTTYFTDEEYARYVRESGRLTQQRIIAGQSASRFNIDNPSARDIERLRKIVESSRLRVRNAIKRARRKNRKAA